MEILLGLLAVVWWVWYERTELSTCRIDPRVGSGHKFAGFWRVESGRVSTSDFLDFTDYFLVPESIAIFKYYIRIDSLIRIFNK